MRANKEAVRAANPVERVAERTAILVELLDFDRALQEKARDILRRINLARGMGCST